MKKYLFYAMQGQKMCFMHVLLNALDLNKAGHEVRIIFEGESVKLPQVLEQDKNPLYLEATRLGLIAGVCLACSRQLNVYEVNRELSFPLLDDMKGHAGILPYVSAGYEVVTF